MLISGKGKCFHGVWLYFKKFSGKYLLVFGKEENTNSEKHKPQPRSCRRSRSEIAIAISPSSRDRDRRRDLAKARSRSSRDRDLAKRRRRSRSGAISPSRDRVDGDLDPVRSREGEIAINGAILPLTATRMFAGEIAIDADWRSRLRARALSLSLSFSGNTLKGK